MIFLFLKENVPISNLIKHKSWKFAAFCLIYMIQVSTVDHNRTNLSNLISKVGSLTPMESVEKSM